LPKPLHLRGFLQTPFASAWTTAKQLTLFRGIARARNNHRLVALLAVVDASLAQAVILNPTFFVYEKTHFNPFLFTHSRHKYHPFKKVTY